MHIFLFGARFKPISDSHRPQWPIQVTVRWRGKPDPWNSLISVRQNGASDDFGSITVIMPDDLPSAMDAGALEECVRSYVSNQVANHVLDSSEGSTAPQDIPTAWRQEFEVINGTWQLGPGGTIEP